LSPPFRHNALNPSDAPEKGIAMADLTYKLLRLSDYPVIPSSERLIDPYLPLGGQIVLAALPKTFKTYVALSWCCCVVTGHPWLDHPVKKGKVLYIALESYHGVLRRKEACARNTTVPKRTSTT
jgi:RecA-family ATPase